jgi:D-alanine-D-alanine ligase-like ATP-grasp enzyme
MEKAGINGKYFAIYSLEQLENALLKEKPDIVYSANMYTYDSNHGKLSIHQYFMNRGIPYIGSKPDVLERALSKSAMKERWRKAGIATPDWLYIPGSSVSNFDLKRVPEEIGFPAIVKPDKEGNSRGLDEASIVFSVDELYKKIKDIKENFSDLIIERYLESETLREYTVAMIGNGDQKILMPARIKLKVKKQHRLVTTSDKDEHNTKAEQVVEKEVFNRLADFSKRAFQVAGVLDYARCDILLKDDRLDVIEVNGLPMIPDKWFEVCAGGVGLNPEQYLPAILYASLQRYIHEKQGNLQIPLTLTEFIPQEIINQLKKG